MSRPLGSYRILDLTNVLAGPFCAYQLGLMGADVIKIEIPETGDLARRLGSDPELNRRLMGASFLAQNAGKRSMTLNLKHDKGVEVFKRLVRDADVLVENFRPHVMKRLGLDYSVLSSINPRLIYCAITGFGQDGPLHDRPAYDQIIQGLSGAMSVTGNEISGPTRVGFPVSDTVGGLTAAFAIAAALLQRESTGEGQFIDVSMLDSTLVMMGWVISNYVIAGEMPKRMGNENSTASPSGAFLTGEGLLNIAANKDEQFHALCQILDRVDLTADPRFSTRDARKSYRYELKDELEKALAKRPAAEWEVVLTEAGIPAGRVLTVADILDHAHTKQRSLLHHFAQVAGVERDVEVITCGFKLSGGTVGVQSPPPRLGADNDSILSELGLGRQEIEDLKQEGVI